MSGAEAFVPTPLLLSDSARKRIKALMAEESNPALKLRVYVTGGGCSGFQYGFDFADSVAEERLEGGVGGASNLHVRSRRLRWCTSAAASRAV